MKITRSQIANENAKLFEDLWRKGNDAGEGLAPDGEAWYSKECYVCLQGDVELYVDDDVVYGVGWANGDWAVLLGRLVD
jgi:hypothetical protein